MFKAKKKVLKQQELIARKSKPVEQVYVHPLSNFTNFDFATKERQLFVQSISPLRQEEKLEYAFWWVLYLVFGMPMPHERKGNRYGY
jgi:hypothetical protein